MKTANKPLPQSELSIRLEALEEAIGLLMEKGTIQQFEDYIRLYRTSFSEIFERAILTRGGPMDAVYYAQTFIQGRWPECEPRVVDSGNTAAILRYAIDVLNSRWREAEQVFLIKSSPSEMCIYAKDVLKGRWPEAEEYIVSLGYKKSRLGVCVAAYYQEAYARTVLPGNWDEDVASKCTCWMYYYAKDVIKGQLPEELHNRMIMEWWQNKADPWCKKYFAAEKYKRVRKPR